MTERFFNERYARHLVLKEVGESGQKKLCDSSVLVVGAGALGSAALTYLACAGVGKLGICDGDEVELSNLQRQAIHSEATVGMKKTASAAKRLKELNSDVAVCVHDCRLDRNNAQEILSGYDFVLDCTDSFRSKFLVNDCCVRYGKPFCHGGALRFGGQVFTCIPRKTPCLRCMLGEEPPADQFVSCKEVGVLGSVTGVIGSVQATEAIKYVTGAGELLTGRIFSFDALTMDVRVSRGFTKDPDCPVCGDGAK